MKKTRQNQTRLRDSIGSEKVLDWLNDVAVLFSVVVPMTAHQPIAPAPLTPDGLPSDEEHRVLRFRPRTLDRPPRRGSKINPTVTPIGSGPEGLSHYAHGQEGAAEYRHRMLTNLAAAAFAVMLALIGIWLANRLADLRNSQDCVLMGRRDCAHINSTAHINMSSSMFRE